MTNKTYNAVGWFEIYVDDLDKMRRFYEAVLAVELSPLEMEVSPAESAAPDMRMLVFPMHEEATGATGALIKMENMTLPPAPGRVMVYFSCEDCAVEAERVVAHGGQIMREKFAIGEHGFIVIAADPEGNMLGLHSCQ